MIRLKHFSLKRKTVFGLIILSFVVLIYIASSLIFGGGNNRTMKSKLNNNFNKSSSVKNSVPTLLPLPKPPLYCSTQISQVYTSSSDYTITNMSCNNPGYSASQPQLSCDGTIFHGVVDLNCYRAMSYSYSHELICTGKLNSANSSNLISLNYSCSSNNPVLMNIYNCSGNIGNYSSSSINLPLSVQCTG